MRGRAAAGTKGLQAERRENASLPGATGAPTTAKPTNKRAEDRISVAFLVAVSVRVVFRVEHAALLGVFQRFVENLIRVRLLGRLAVRAEHPVPKRGVPAEASGIGGANTRAE